MKPGNDKTKKRKKKNPAMKGITINLPIYYITAIAKLIEKGIIPSRSEAVRTALRDYLHSEIVFLEALRDNDIELIYKAIEYRTNPEVKPDAIN